MTTKNDIVAKVEAYLKANPTASKAAALKALKIKPNRYYRHLAKTKPKKAAAKKKPSSKALHAELQEAITGPVRKSDKVIVMVVDPDAVGDVLRGLRT